MTLDKAIKEDKKFLKNFIGYYEQKLNNKYFKYIYRKLRNFYLTATFTSAFTALLLKNNINPLEYMDEVPEYFAYGLDIEDFVIPNNIIEISPYAFEDCSVLTNIIIPGSITIIDSNAFKNCISLTNINIPKSVKTISYDAFNGCSNLTDVYYEGSKKDWENIEIKI